MNIFLVQWTLTTLCERRCKHCYIDKNDFNKKGLEYSYITSIIDKLYNYSKLKSYRLHINFTGGDPLLRSDLFKILEYINTKGVSFSIMGNPDLVTQENAKLLSYYNIGNYQLSIDSIDKKHNLIRNSDVYNKTLKAIDILKGNNIPVSIMTTISNLNKDELIEIVDLAECKHVDSVSFSRYVPLGNGIENSVYMLSKSAYKNCLINIIKKKICLIKRNSKTKILLKEDCLFPLLANDLDLDIQEYKEYFQQFICGIFKNFIAIDFDGTVYPCRRLPVKLGNILYDEVETIFASNTHMYLRDINNHPKCKDCNFNITCRGCLAVKYDHFESKLKDDPQCWKI